MSRQDALDGVTDVARVLHDGPMLVYEANEVWLDVERGGVRRIVEGLLEGGEPVDGLDPILPIVEVGVVRVVRVVAVDEERLLEVA